MQPQQQQQRQHPYVSDDSMACGVIVGFIKKESLLSVKLCGAALLCNSQPGMLRLVGRPGKIPECAQLPNKQLFANNMGFVNEFSFVFC